MTKCLVTKLKGSVNNDSMAKIGELEVQVVNELKDNIFIPSVGIKATYRIVGDGYFVNSDGSNVGKVTDNTDYKLSPGKYKMYISNKYDFTGFQSSESNPIIQLNLNKLCFSTNITNINCNSNTYITGDLEVIISKLRKLTYLGVANTQLIGDIAIMKDYPTTIHVNAANSLLSGDIANLADNNVILDSIVNCKNLYGDIASIKGQSVISSNIKNTKINGDLSTAPVSWNYVESSYSQNMTWKNTRPSNANFMGMSGVNLGSYVDDMLINQATLNFDFEDGNKDWLKKIIVMGTRTSASDSAIETLNNKGITVSVVSE